MSEELEKLRHKQYVAERKLTAAKHKEKRLQSELKRLTRSERTHRLCTRAGIWHNKPEYRVRHRAPRGQGCRNRKHSTPVSSA